MLEGVIITNLKQFYDDRGSVLHMINKNSESFKAFGEVYFSEIFPRCVKAWKKHKIQTQNFVVPVGNIKLVIFDDREYSSTKGEVQVIEMGRPYDYIRVTIPPNLWYGFTCISNVNSLLVNCADYAHDASESFVCDINSNLIPYKWNNE